MKNILFISILLLVSCASPNSKLKADKAEPVYTVGEIPTEDGDFVLDIAELQSKYPEFFRYANRYTMNSGPNKFRGDICLPEMLLTNAWGNPDEMIQRKGNYAPSIVAMLSNEYRTLGAVFMYLEWSVVKHSDNTVAIWKKGNYHLSASLGSHASCGPDKVFREITITDMSKF